MSSASLESALEKISKSSAELVGSGDLVGLGSGSTVARFARALGKRVGKESLKIRVVPSSSQAWLLARENKLPFDNDTAHCPTEIDIAIDGADQISLPTRSMIKGGGGALLKEKIILSSARKCYILGDEAKYVKQLSRSVPAEVTQFSVLACESKLRSSLHADPVLRKLDKGYPFFTESGNVILDCQFKKPLSDPALMEKNIKMIAGVVEAGIFNCKVEKFYKANQDGTFETF